MVKTKFYGILPINNRTKWKNLRKLVILKRSIFNHYENDPTIESVKSFKNPAITDLSYDLFSSFQRSFNATVASN